MRRRSGQEKKERSGLPGYKKPCRYCEGLIAPESKVCPLCGKVSPLGSPRCPRCRSQVEKGWIRCGDCGLSLEVVCPFCGEQTFFGDYCDKCDARLLVTCPNRKCGEEQPPIGGTCVKCGKPLKL
jgi:hypothetical protein